MEHEDTIAIRKRLAAVITKQQELLAILNTLLQNGGSAAQIDEAQRQLDRAGAEQTRLLTELRLAQMATPEEYGSALRGQRPLREIVLDALNDLSVPAAPRLVSEYAGIVYGQALPTTRFASLRRDEERAYQREPTSRPAWVVPAINVVGLTAIPRIIANSAWEAERRLIGSRTLRTNHLRTLLALLTAHGHIAEAHPDLGPGTGRTERRVTSELLVQRLDRLIVQYAQTVPGALEYATPLDGARVRGAANAELARIEPPDLEERSAAAVRLQQLPPLQQLWGSFPVVEGGVIGRMG